jgi:hypothetical protein
MLVHLAVEALMGKAQHVVGRALRVPGGNQLVPIVCTRDRVVELDKVLPGGLRVPGLGRDGGQVEAQGVGVVVAEEVGHVDGGSPTLAELSTFEVEVFMVTRDKTRSP